MRYRLMQVLTLVLFLATLGLSEAASISTMRGVVDTVHDQQYLVANSYTLQPTQCACAISQCTTPATDALLACEGFTDPFSLVPLNTVQRDSSAHCAACACNSTGNPVNVWSQAACLLRP